MEVLILAVVERGGGYKEEGRVVVDLEHPRNITLGEDTFKLLNSMGVQVSYFLEGCARYDNELLMLKNKRPD